MPRHLPAASARGSREPERQSVSSGVDAQPLWLLSWQREPDVPIRSNQIVGVTYPIPTHTPLFLGTINQRYRPRYGAPAQAFHMWIDRINARVTEKLVPPLGAQDMLLTDSQYAAAPVNSDPYSLANISDFNTLIARSQDAGVPIFELSDAELKVTGPLLNNMKKSRDAFRELFAGLAETVIRLTGAEPRAKKKKKTARRAAP